MAGLTPGCYVVLTVADSGHGMTAATLQNLFKPLFTTKSRGQGTGLGLAIVHTIVLESGGQIEVASEPGKGARFTVYLRSADQKPLASQEFDSAVHPELRGAETILLVHTEASLRSLVSEILTSHGYAVHEASNQLETEAAIEAHGPNLDLILAGTLDEPTHAAITRAAIPVLGMSSIGKNERSTSPAGVPLGIQELLSEVRRAVTQNRGVA